MNEPPESSPRLRVRAVATLLWTAGLLVGLCVPPVQAAPLQALSAEEAARLAIATSPTLRALEKASEAARARAQAAGAWSNPALVSQFQSSPDLGNHMLTFGLRQPLDFRQLAQQRREAAEDEALTLELRLAATRRQVGFQARRSHVSLWLAEAGVQDHSRLVGFLQGELARGQRRVAAGALAAHELIHTEFELAMARQKLNQAQASGERARAQLNLLLGRPVDAPVTLPGMDPAVPAPPGELKRWIQEALSRRVEPRAAELAARRERRGMRLAESLRFGEGELDLQGGTAGPLLAPLLYGAFALPVPLWNDYRAEVAAHAAEAARQDAERTAAEAAIAAEVTDAWLETRLAAARVREISDGALALALHAVEKAEARLKAGAGTAVELLTARQERLEAETAHRTALLSYHLARLRLEEACGR
ncbi:MAG: TolC family protein [Candidatus Sericytochromatia bacterium]|nr:TolC family protein [Candidatus Sericytochromatia bacterium]